MGRDGWMKGWMTVLCEGTVTRSGCWQLSSSPWVHGALTAHVPSPQAVPSQDMQASRPLELCSGSLWFWRGCSPCSKGGDMSQGRSRCQELAVVGVT